MTPTRLLAAGVLASALGLAAAPARASSPTELLGPLVDAVRSFCGFYVAGADAKLFNDATLVVLMREGTRTVLSMQNDYQGPPEDFALVIPVPVVLQEGDVKTLPKELFDRVDKLAAPRLVEYWEEDPCEIRRRREREKKDDGAKLENATAQVSLHGVTIEAKFEVGEYQVVILSAEDSTGLETWLDQEKYNIPAGAAPLLQPYVQSGMKFFVAKVDSKKVKFENGRATLSPLRFHYDSPEFSLPVRLGLINAKGPQDLLIHILAKQQRYQVANYPNAIIPTNLEVQDITKQQFGKFYVSLFDHTLANTPGAVVTEYAWAAGSCDPCPEPALTLRELYMLGADVLPSYAQSLHTIEQGTVSPELEWQIPSEFVLTRLHARYDASALAEDLVFAAAPPIGGGREWPTRADGSLEIGPIDQPGGTNDFQARYIIRHPWEGKIACQDPLRGVWGGPPSGAQQPTIARQTAFEDRSASLASFVSAGASRAALGLEPPPATIDPPKTEPIERPPTDAKSRDEQTKKSDTKQGGAPEGCACSASEDVPGRQLGLAALALLGLSTLRTPRHRRSHA